MAYVSSSANLDKCPRLRFPGFDGPWESHTLGDFLARRNVKQTPGDGAPLMAFTADGGVRPKGTRYDRSHLVKNGGKLYKRTELNDFIYSSNNLDVGAMGLNRYGTAVISDVYEIFSVKEKYAPAFIDALVHRPYTLNRVLRCRQGCVYGQYRIYADDFLSVPALAPSPREQAKLAAFFDELDCRISLQRKMAGALKKYKRGHVTAAFHAMKSRCISASRIRSSCSYTAPVSAIFRSSASNKLMAFA